MESAIETERRDGARAAARARTHLSPAIPERLRLWGGGEGRGLIDYSCQGLDLRARVCVCVTYTQHRASEDSLIFRAEKIHKRSL